jgi:GntR family transcriptional regulator, carbon starvation induced regulator
MALNRPVQRKTPLLQQGTAENGAILVTSAPKGAADREPAAFDVLRHMREDILSGQFEPGQRLKIDELRARYDASVGTLREALLHLLSEGLVRSAMNRGFSVAPVSVADLRDITELRIQFEVRAMSDAIKHGDEAWEAEIVTALHLLLKLGTGDAPVTRSAEWPARHRRFHQALVSGCRSPWLLHFRSTLFDQAERYRSLGRTHRRSPRDVNVEHQQLADAALARNVAKACDLAEKHIRRTVDNIAKVLGLGAAKR